MSTIYIRLSDNSIIEVPYSSELITQIQGVAINPKITKIRESNKVNFIVQSDNTPDPFGLKKPIYSSNKKK